MSTPDTLVEKVKLLVQEVTEKNEVLVSTQASLSRAEATLNEANLSLDLAQENIEDLEAYLKKIQEGQEKVEDGLHEICLLNCALFKEYVN